MVQLLTVRESTDRLSTARLKRWQAATIGSLFLGYSGYYVCRTVLPVASTGMLNDPDSGIDEVKYGELVGAGIYLYAIGKLFNGVLTEYAGGRRMFVFGMILSAVLVAGMGLAPGVGLLLGLWAANRFVQSMGWSGLVQIAGRWFSPDRLATVMAILSLSYLFGAAAAQAYLGLFAKAGAGWRELFLIAAATLAAITVLVALFLRGSPKAVGLPEPPPAPGNVHGQSPSDKTMSLIQLLGPLVRSRLFWLVCLMNMGLTAIRETFNAWTPRYLEKAVGIDSHDVGLLAALFPFFGAVSCLAAGWIADRLRGRFGRIMVPLVAAATLALFALTTIDLHGRPIAALALISMIALLVMGPYSFCAGVLALRLGGQRAGAASAGIIDSAGYFFGAVISGEVAGQLVKLHGFAPLLEVLVGISAATLVAAVAFWFFEER